MHFSINPTPARFEWFRQKLQTLVYKLDNSGDTDIEHNGEHAFIRSLCTHYTQTEPIVVLDVGANYDDYTALLLETRGLKTTAIHAFEPQRSCFAKLTELFGNTPGVTINNVGLSDKAATTTLFKNTEGSGLASLYKRDLQHYGIDLGKTEEISLARADAYLAKHHISHIHLLKLDIEGHEIPAFHGFGDFLSADHIDFIQFEYGGANLDAKSSLRELFTLLEGKGFIMTKIMRRGLERRAYYPRLENFVYQNWVAVSPRVLAVA
jgi:FkbM family methyltransferase